MIEGIPIVARAKARAGGRQRLASAVGACDTDSPALLGLLACRITHYASCARSVQTDAASQSWKRAARAAKRPAVLGASDARRRPPARAFAAPVVDLRPGTAGGPRRDRAYPAGAISGSASRRAGTRAVQWTARAARAAGPQGPARPARPGPGEARTQCALRRLTHGICSSAAPAGRVASYAVLARAEQRSGVGAQRRPTQHEPLAGAPWRDARRRSNAHQP
jgi:hypothetical protein